MFGVRPMLGNPEADDAAAAGPAAGSPTMIGTRTTFGIHVLDDDSALDPSPNRAPGSAGAVPSGATLHGVLSPRPDSTSLGAAREERRPTPSPSRTPVGGVGGASSPGMQADAEYDQSLDQTMVGLSAYRPEDDEFEPVPRADLEDDWLDDIQDFIEEKVADGTLNLPDDHGSTPTGVPTSTDPPAAAVAGFGIVKRTRSRRAAGKSNAPVATAGSADRRALAAQSEHHVDRVSMRPNRASESQPGQTPAAAPPSSAAGAISGQMLAGLAGTAGPGAAAARDSLDYLVDVADQNPATRPTEAMSALPSSPAAAGLPRAFVDTPGTGSAAVGVDGWAGGADQTLGFAPDLVPPTPAMADEGRGITLPGGADEVDVTQEAAHAFLEQAAPASPAAPSVPESPIAAAMGPAPPPTDARFAGAVPQRPQAPPDLVSVARERGLGGRERGASVARERSRVASAPKSQRIAIIAVVVAIVVVAALLAAMLMGGGSSGPEAEPTPEAASEQPPE